MAVKLMIDSASDISKREADELGITLIPMIIGFGEEEYFDGVDLLPKQFYEKLVESNELPKTSQITAYRFEKEFKRLTANGDEVVAIVISSKLSGTYESARQAAGNFGGKVFVVDSLNACIGERLLGQYALRLVKDGLSGAEIAKKLDEAKGKINVMAMVNTLEYLKKGGRVSPAVAFAGELLSIKPVVAVLGCGADVVYPAHNKKLYADTEQHGCLITEYPPEEKPLGWHFPRRNRIISGLSNGVLVVEEPEGSGALITARRAADQGRDVFVVPGNIGVKSCIGSNALLREGAISVTCGWDVVSEYAFLYPDGVYESNARSVAGQVISGKEKQTSMVAQKPKIPGYDRENDRKKEKKPIDNLRNQGYSDQSKPIQNLTEEEKQVLAGLEDTCLVDDLIARLKMPAGKVLSCLTMLQIKGLVRQLPGNRVAPIG